MTKSRLKKWKQDKLVTKRTKKATKRKKKVAKKSHKKTLVTVLKQVQNKLLAKLEETM